MNTKQLLLAALMAGAYAPALALTLSEAPLALQFDEADAPQVVRERIVIDAAATEQLQHAGHAPFTGALMFGRGRVVKDAPYSAEVVSEQSHTLGDGNQIASRSSSLTYRDSAGRTRQEMRDAAGAVRSVTIHDNVAGTTTILRPDSKTATRIAAPAEFARAAAERARASGEVARAHAEAARAIADKARAEAQRHREKDGEQVFIKRIERGEGDDGQRVREEVRIRIARDMAEVQPMAGMDRFGPMIAGAFGDMKWASKASTKDLGSKEIEGLKAQGKLRSYEIPAGEIGNRNAIVVSTESWYAPDLQVTLLSKHSDPRSGERVYRLAGIKREEPAAALFAIPADYTLKEPLTSLKK